MREKLKTLGQIYDSNFSIRIANTRKFHPDWTEEKVREDSISMFGTRDEFIKRWLGGEEVTLPTLYNEDEYERVRKFFEDTVTATFPTYGSDQIDHLVSEFVPPVDQ